MRPICKVGGVEFEVARANRRFWDDDATRYHDAHPEYLSGFYWCPEMLSEASAGLLGSVSGLRVLEIGCGSAPCSSWLLRSSSPSLVVGFDISMGMLSRSSGVPVVQADVQALPFADDSFDVTFSAFGGFAFVPSIPSVFADVARVLTPGGRFVFSANHPMRWVFPDDPTSAGLTACIPYFESSYSERDDDGNLTYAEYHRTFGEWVRALVSAGFVLDDVVEPEWPVGLDVTFGQWSPLRGSIFPGTAIFVAHLG